MSAAGIKAQIPQIRPHIQRRGRKVFFLVSRRPLLELSLEEIPLYDGIDGRRTLSELEEMHPGACNRIVRWREAALIELLPPIASPSGPHLVVIEPHMDDAALSVGGRLLHRWGRGRTTILSVVRWSNFTSYMNLKRSFLNVNEITDLRQKESALAARLLGAEHRCLDWSDAPIRFCPPERWSLATVESFNTYPQDFVLAPNRRDVSLLAEQLLQTLELLTPNELWIPMGLGDHADHAMTRNACLMMLAAARDRFSGVPIIMYEDVPHVVDAVGHAEQICATFAECGTCLVRDTEDVTDVFEDKLRAISVYASQFKLSYMEPKVRGVAEREGGAVGRFAEAYYRLQGNPCLPPASRLSRDCSGLTALHTSLRALLPEAARCRRVAVIALPSGHLGRWKVDRESLITAFPNADVHVRAPENIAWQAPEGGKNSLKLQFLHGGWGPWVGLLFRELFRFRTPTLVLWRGAYGSGRKRKHKRAINLLIKLLLPFRQVLFARTLNDFSFILDEELARSPIMRSASLDLAPRPDKLTTGVSSVRSTVRNHCGSDGPSHVRTHP
jgi:LmbE family N-acetylglucosaminyl deacetylase